MKLTKCENGHFYDADKSSECPYCNRDLQDGGEIVEQTTLTASVQNAPKGPVTGWLVVLQGPARGRDLRLGEGRNFLGLDTGGLPAVLSADSPLGVRQGILVYDPQDGSWSALPGSSNELCTLNGKSLLERRALRAGDRIGLGGAVLRFVPLCDEEFRWT